MTGFEAIGRYPFNVDAYLTDFNGNATLAMIGRFMLQAATIHAEERGFGYSYMTDNNKAWVLSRMSIEMKEYPKNDDALILSTWVQDVNRLFTTREFCFTLANGKVLGYARTLWASIDLGTRKPTNISELDSMNSYITKDQICPIGEYPKLKSSDDAIFVDKFTIKYSDIDINGHLNSIKYIEHLIDTFSIDLFKNKKLEKVDLHYIAEGKFGANVEIYQKESLEDNKVVYELDMRSNKNSICLARIIWK